MQDTPSPRTTSKSSEFTTKKLPPATSKSSECTSKKLLTATSKSTECTTKKTPPTSSDSSGCTSKKRKGSNVLRTDLPAGTTKSDDESDLINQLKLESAKMALKILKSKMNYNKGANSDRFHRLDDDILGFLDSSEEEESDNEDIRERLQNEVKLLELQNYKVSLDCAIQERTLGLPPSKYTAGVFKK